MEHDRITIQRVVGTAGTVQVAVALVGVVVIVGWGLATQTGTNRVMAAVLGVLAAVMIVLVAWRCTWVDTGAGTITLQVAGVWSRTVAWSAASEVGLHVARAGQRQLVVRGADGSVRIVVLSVDADGGRSLETDQLRLLAAEIARWAPDRGAVADALRSQADHLDRGGDVRDSPLAALDL